MGYNHRRDAILKSFVAFVHSLWALATFLVLGAISMGRYTCARQPHVDKVAIEFTVAIEELYACKENVVCCKLALLHAESRVARAEQKSQR